MSHEFRRSETADFPKNKNIIKITKKNSAPSRAHVGNRDGPKKNFQSFTKDRRPLHKEKGREGWLSKIESDKRNLSSRVQSAVKRGESTVCAKKTQNVLHGILKKPDFFFTSLLRPPIKNSTSTQNNNKKTLNPRSQLVSLKNEERNIVFPDSNFPVKKEGKLKSDKHGKILWNRSLGKRNRILEPKAETNTTISLKCETVFLLKKRNSKNRNTNARRDNPSL